MAYDDSGVSLAASDPNPTIDQYDDGGSSADYSSILSSVGQWGTEIAAVVTNRPLTVSPSGATFVGPSPSSAVPPMSSTTKLLLVGALVVGGVIAFHYLS